MYSVPKLKSFTEPSLERRLGKLLAALEIEAKAVKNEEDWKVFRDHWMARKNGVLTQINDLWLKAAPKEAKREVGRRVNEIRDAVTATVEKARPGAMMASAHAGAKASGTLNASIDSTASTSPSPASLRPLGAEHPVIKTVNEIVSVFRNLGTRCGKGR